MTINNYHPERYWDSKATNSAGDPMRATCVDGVLANRCIERIQRSLLLESLAFIDSIAPSQQGEVLDFGCGSGRWVHLFTSHGYRYTGVDISSEMIKLATTHHPNSTFQKVIDNHLAFPDNSFDLIASIAVLHHNPIEEQDRLLREFQRVSRHGSFLLLFESLVPHTEHTQVEFGRRSEEWRVALNRNNFQILFSCGTSYWIIRKFMRRIADRIPISFLQMPDGAESTSGTCGFLDKIVAHLDILLDPYLRHLLPKRFHDRTLMVCRKF